MRADCLPIIFSFVALLATFASYAIAVSLDHVPAFLPFISDSGVFVPERSVFSFLINTAAVLHVVNIYVRYAQVRAEILARWNEENFRGRKMRFLNTTSMIMGLFVSFGISLIGNFQLHTERLLEPEGLELSREELIVQKIHWLGCLLTFLGGLVWMSIQAVISIFLSLGTKKGQWRRRLAFFRCIIVMTSIIIIFSGIATGLSSAVLPGDQASDGGLRWNDNAKTSDQNVKGRLSLTSVLCEWIATFLLFAFAISLAPEFKDFEVTVVKLKLKKQHCQQDDDDVVLPAESTAMNLNDTSADPLMQLS